MLNDELSESQQVLMYSDAAESVARHLPEGTKFVIVAPNGVDSVFTAGNVDPNLLPQFLRVAADSLESEDRRVRAI